jgi:lipopolysaccharide assembly outer membrane protein LptD (OstA)
MKKTRASLRLGGLLLLLVFSALLQAQVPVTGFSTSVTPAEDTSRVQIIGADRLTLLKTDDSTTIQILAGGVRLKQGKTLFFCDSCVLNNSGQLFEAWGNVQIKDNDSINVFSRHLRYLIDKKLAYLDGGVRLTDGKAQLNTPDLEYDLNTDIGIYKKGGKLVNKKTTLTSKEGYYYASLKEVYFKNDVYLKDPAYEITTDSLLYNTQTQTNRFIAQTLIVDSTGRSIRTTDGFYSAATGKATFGKRPVIKDGATTIIGDRVAFDDSSGTSQAAGNVLIVDTAQGTTLLAGEVFRDNKKERFLATKKPLLIIEQEKDSIYVTADTIYSGKQSELSSDSTKKSKTDSLSKSKDSSDRYLEAFHHVRIFSDSLQAVCDSLFYSYKDSTYRLFTDPVIWSNGSQITGDTVLLFTKNRKPDRLKVFENSMLVQQQEPGLYNQIASIRMDGYFSRGELDSVRAIGEAKTIYYIQDEDSAYTGINESKSDIIDIYLLNKELDKIVLRNEVSGTIWPIGQKDPLQMRLPSFRWLESRRPKSKLELIE